MPGPIPAKHSPWIADLPGDQSSLSVGSEVTNAITVTCQFKDYRGNNTYDRRAMQAYLSGAADGSTLATAANGGVAAATYGLVVPEVTGQVFLVVTDASGRVNVVITDTGTPTVYLVIILPDGSLKISAAITFA